MLMKRRKNKSSLPAGGSVKAWVFLVLLVVLGMATAQQGGVYEITKSTLSSGGGNSSGGAFSVRGSIAQVDASEELSGGDFSVTGGFWPGSDDLIFKNGFDQ